MRSTAEHGGWRPILTGLLAEQARTTVELISAHLRDMPPNWAPDILHGTYRDSASNALSLANGCAGQAVFHAYLSHAWSQDKDRERAFQLLEKAIDLLAVTHTRPSLYAGYTGVAWVTEHLRTLLMASGGDDPNEAIDEALFEHLSCSSWQEEYDLVHGLVGFGVYALERLPNQLAARCLSRVVEHLDRLARREESGTTWLSPPTLLPAQERALATQGCCNLGVAHGVPGIIALLGQACACDVARDKAQPLLEDAVRWLLAQQLPNTSGSAFPYWVGPNIQPTPARLAWCYGDAGIAAALLHAARCVETPAWQHDAIALARRAAHRRIEDSEVVDAGLCHGAAGLGHVFNRLYQATHEEELKQAACRWFEYALELRRAGEGIAGFLASVGFPDGQKSWVADPYFLTGAAGIGLALLAAITPIEPVWDRVLLVSIPPACA